MDSQNNIRIDLTIVGTGGKRMDPTPNDFSIGAIRLRGWQVDRIEAPADGFDGDDIYLVKINYELDLELGLPRMSWFEMAFDFSSAAGDRVTVIDALPRSGTLTDTPKSYVLNRFLNLVPCEDGASAHAHLPAISDRIDAFGIGGPGVRWRHLSLDEAGIRVGSYAAWAVLLVPSGQTELRVDFRARFNLAVGSEVEYRPAQSPTDFQLRLTPPADTTGVVTPSLAAGDANWSEEPNPSVFICYAHDTLQHQERARQFGNLLAESGVDVHMDQWDETDRKNWAFWALDLIEKVDFVIVLASPICRKAFDGKLEGTDNLGIRSEAVLILENLHTKRDEWTSKVLPVVLPHELTENISTMLQPWTTDHYDIRRLTPEGIQGLLRAMTGVARHTRPPLGELPPSVRKPLSGTES
ncbi:toll/interleukin-1 receptor domain-containing protein [Streptomyces sp. Amel2xC10]|uniref:toll/interleukin-1 receptor domain-containing protein n=1 Tax=Streptomyces sp. Amel2xC10 TaxID=1305826 RepID=UPI000A08E24F|nr:toll/interleukin-1 receptor domain-containing protein [Streptomyces sp. Amel2xC10]SMF39007.1 SEFIR domain-containing protein [Streptomyces sp. Amel2xC10]